MAMGRKRGLPKGDTAPTGDTAPKAAPKAASKAGKDAATKAPLATEADKAKTKSKLTYPKAIVHAIKVHGLLSRAALSKELSAHGLSNEAQIKTALKAQLKAEAQIKTALKAQ